MGISPRCRPLTYRKEAGREGCGAVGVHVKPDQIEAGRARRHIWVVPAFETPEHHVHRVH